MNIRTPEEIAVRLAWTQDAVRNKGLCGFAMDGAMVCIATAGHDPAHAVESATPTPVCAVCKDTHSMSLRDRMVMCTHCPIPCGHCRQSSPGAGLGAYCATTPCGCECHRGADGADVERPTQDVAQMRLTGKPSSQATEAVALARQAIDKYGADSPKPSVVLAKALLEGAHERDRLRTQLRELKEHMLSTERVSKMFVDDAVTDSAARGKLLQDATSELARLKEELEVARDQTCARHAGQAHGKEAEELRAGIEQILKNTADFKDGLISVTSGAAVLIGVRKTLQFLLDRVDARDSLAYLEASDIAKTTKVPT